METQDLVLVGSSMAALHHVLAMVALCSELAMATPCPALVIVTLYLESAITTLCSMWV